MKHFEPIPAETEQTAKAVVDGAFHVHKNLGPGLLETVYEVCLAYELTKRQVNAQRQVDLPIVYDGVRLEAGFRIDLLAGENVVVELKAVDALLPIHEAQMMTYLKLSGKRLGFLINFNVERIKDGIRRIVL